MLRSYVVQPGDTLISIAEKVYGEAKAWTDIYRANEHVILDPYNLQPGTELYVPPSAETIHEQVHEHHAQTRKIGDSS
jgi:nucleoid-associated protein YgaU